jgi:hypothetical protein
MNAFLILDKTIKSMLAWMKSLPPANNNQSLLNDPLPGRDLFRRGDHLDTEIDQAMRNPPGDPLHDHYFGRK